MPGCVLEFLELVPSKHASLLSVLQLDFDFTMPSHGDY
jgi:hypothetical protein